VTTPTRGAWTGRQLSGRYEVHELIGRGGMADVYRGMDARLGRDVAIKVLKSTLNSDQVSRDRFRKEAMSASKMAHPTIVRVFDAGDEMDNTDGAPEGQTTPFIVMEYVEGKLLSEIIRRGVIDEAAALGIADGVLTALEFSHKEGIIHRDIKPANIMITRTGGVKVMDFGIATVMADHAGVGQAPSSILGTALYLSPEQAQGAEATAQSDLYSLGVVLYEMIAGRPPFQGESPVAVAYQHISEEPAPLKLQNPQVTAGTAAIVMKLLDKDPARRFSSATLVRKAMEALPPPQASATPTESEAAPTPTPAPPVAAGEPPVREHPRATEPPPVTGTIPQPTWQRLDDPSVDLPIPLGSGAQSASVPKLAIGLGSVLAIGMLVAIVVWLFTLNPTTVINTQAPTIPDLAGSSQQVAESEITRLGLVPAIVERVSSEVEVGTVIETIPGPGIRVALGERVQIVVSAGGSLIRVPDVRNLPSDEASQRLISEGLAVAPFQEDYSPNLPAGTVMQTLPAPGEEVAGNTEVIMTLSNGLVLVPNVVNLTIGEANPLLTGPGLQLTVTLQADPTCTGGVVRSQSLSPGEHPQRSTITLVYCGAAAFEPPAPENPDD
jgi:eukaryotic-like serine/threonine-protein kinase